VRTRFADDVANILVVDDFAPVRQELCSIIENTAGCHVVGQASDGLEAVEKSAELRPDLILLDIGLPTLNGIDAAKRIWELSPEVKILFVSQESSIHVVQELLRMGAVGYVCKADLAAELSAAVLSALRWRAACGS
jgi:DNA-binding NarL/FixJ family response regulator